MEAQRLCQQCGAENPPNMRIGVNEV